jgi:RNase P subunit RPR2
MKERICKKCGVALVPGVSARVRLSSHNSYVAYICTYCGAERHKRY